MDFDIVQYRGRVTKDAVLMRRNMWLVYFVKIDYFTGRADAGRFPHQKVLQRCGQSGQSKDDLHS